ncbi:hypothetical protein [Ideonella paludis]|nr:hypothetical protein [Ideonella paludis]
MMKNTLILLTLSVALSACQALGEVAYDLALDAQGDQCNSTLSYDAQRACKAKVETSRQQAEKVRAEGSNGGLERPAKGKDLCFMRAGERVCPN